MSASVRPSVCLARVCPPSLNGVTKGPALPPPRFGTRSGCVPRWEGNRIPSEETERERESSLTLDPRPARMANGLEVVSLPLASPSSGGGGSSGGAGAGEERPIDGEVGQAPAETAAVARLSGVEQGEEGDVAGSTGRGRLEGRRTREERRGGGHRSLARSREERGGEKRRKGVLRGRGVEVEDCRSFVVVVGWTGGRRELSLSHRASAGGGRRRSLAIAVSQSGRVFCLILAGARDQDR